MGQTRFAEEGDSLRSWVETILREGVPPLRSLQTAPRPVLSFLSACLFFLLRLLPTSQALGRSASIYYFAILRAVIATVR